VKRPDLSLVLVNCSSLALTTAALASIQIQQHTGGFPYETIVVDKGSHDASVTELRNDLAVMVAEAMGQPPHVTHLAARNEVMHAVADHATVERVFGHRAKWSLREGQRMGAWAQRVGPRRPSTFGQIEVERNLPPSWRTR
jgi:hypothetical protein